MEKDQEWHYSLDFRRQTKLCRQLLLQKVWGLSITTMYILFLRQNENLHYIENVTFLQFSILRLVNDQSMLKLRSILPHTPRELENMRTQNQKQDKFHAFFFPCILIHIDSWWILVGSKSISFRKLLPRAKTAGSVFQVGAEWTTRSL